MIQNMKNETIYRLRNALNQRDKLMKSKIDSPSQLPRNFHNMPAEPDDNKITELQNEIEDLQSQNEILRRRYVDLSVFV